MEISRGGAVTLWYHDDDMMSGHRIRAIAGKDGIDDDEIVGRRPGLVPASDRISGTVVDRFTGRDDDGHRALVCRLTPWRRGEGAICMKPLFLTCAIEKGTALKADPSLQKLVKRANVTLRCRFTENTPANARALLLAVEESSADGELMAAIEASRPPVEMVSPILGEIRLAPSTDRLVGNRGNVEICMDRNRSSIAEDVALAEAAITALEPRLGALSRDVADQLVALYNENWRSEDAPIETTESFAERIELESIDVEEEGIFTLWYSDDDLFAGHHINARVGPDGLEEPQLFG